MKNKKQYMKQRLQEYADAYHKGNPLISDAEYDALEDAYTSIYGDTPIGTATGEVYHVCRMYSLNKIHGDVNDHGFNSEVVMSPKLDGCAIQLTYVEGSLVAGATRGNGFIGKDITVQCKLLKSIPDTVITDQLVLYVRGEVVADVSIDNSRNLASGLMNTLDPNEFNSKAKELDARFIAYDSPTLSKSESTYLDTLSTLHNAGFYTVADQDWKEYPQDGIVVRVNNNTEYDKLGYTSKYPKGAVAWKPADERHITTLSDVIWQVGKSGKVTPVAILDAVTIDDAVITRATLNNIGYIKDLGLSIGDKVVVIRSGGIIPKIIGKAEET